MPPIGPVLLGAAALFVVIFVCWRLSSRRHTIPCPAWLSWLVEIDNPFFVSTRARTIIAHLDLRPGMRALDVGCGPGRLAIPMARKVGPTGRIVALDIQAGMLRRAKAKAERAKLTNIDFHEAKIGNNELHLDSFDRAVLVAVLGEIPDQEAALRKIFDALKPGGVLAVTEVIADPHFQTRGRVLALASLIGFCEKKRIGGPPSVFDLSRKTAASPTARVARAEPSGLAFGKPKGRLPRNRWPPCDVDKSPGFSVRSIRATFAGKAPERIASSSPC